MQGFEDRVLIGSQKFIKSKVPILIEFNKNFSKKIYYKKIINILETNYKYVIFFNEDKIIKKKITSLKEIFLKYKNNKTEYNCLIY